MRKAHTNESRRAYVYIFGVAHIHDIFGAMFCVYAVVSGIGYTKRASGTYE